jgi:hypothetical protein
MKLWLFGSVILVLAAAAYLIARWWRNSGGRQLLLSLPFQSWPDFRKWDRHGEFKLEEAAALWFDAEPRSPMWWGAQWKLRRLRAAGGRGNPSRRVPQGLTVGTLQSRLTRQFIATTLAEREGVHPLFLYPEFRFRSQDRDKETDKARLASIHEAVRYAISNVESELKGLQARLEYAHQSPYDVAILPE